MTVPMFGIGLLLSILALHASGVFFRCLASLALTKLSLMELSDKTRQKREAGGGGTCAGTGGRLPLSKITTDSHLGYKLG